MFQKGQCIMRKSKLQLAQEAAAAAAAEKKEAFSAKMRGVMNQPEVKAKVVASTKAYYETHTHPMAGKTFTPNQKANMALGQKLKKAFDAFDLEGCEAVIAQLEQNGAVVTHHKQKLADLKSQLT